MHLSKFLLITHPGPERNIMLLMLINFSVINVDILI